MGKYVGKYESKEKTRKRRRSSLQNFLLYIAIYVAVSLIGLVIMTLLGWDIDFSRSSRDSTEFVVGLVAIVLVCWIIGAVGNAIRKKKKESE